MRVTIDKTALKRVFLAASKDKSRAIMTGIGLTQVDGVNVVCATDTHRLTFAPVTARGVLDSVCVPCDAVKTALKGRARGPVAFESRDFGKPDDRGIIAKFPPVTRVIPDPASMGVTVTFTAEALEEALACLLPMQAKGETTRVILTPNAGALGVQDERKHSSADAHGNATEYYAQVPEEPLEVPGSRCDGPGFVVAFNRAYLMDALRGHTGTVTLRLTTTYTRYSLARGCEEAHSDPKVCKSARFDYSDTPGEVTVLMPMQVL